MKTNLIFLTLILGVQNLTFSQENTDSYALADIVSEIKVALQKSQTNLNNLGLPELKSVDLTFETVGSKTIGGKVNFLIFSFGKEVTKEQVQVVSFKLTPPKPGKSIAVAAGMGLSESLTAALENASKSMQNVDLANSEPKLKLSELSVELKFVVKKGIEGGASFEIMTIGVDLGAKIGKSTVHKIKVSFNE